MLRLSVSRPVCLGVRPPSGTHDRILIIVRQLRVCWCGAPSLTTGRFCSLLAVKVMVGPTVSRRISYNIGIKKSSQYLTGNTLFSPTKPNQLILFGETAAVHCENHTEHTDTVRTSQVTDYVSATENNRLMLFGETVAVYCENHTEHTDTVPHRKHITSPLHRPTG
jgi:hypothetical protein